MAQYEFLPLCDVLFNIISLALYFCDTIFDIVMAYALFQRDRHFWFTVTISCVVVSLFVSQIVSLRWYLNACEAQNRSKEKVIDDYGIQPLSTVKRLVRWSVVFLHIIQFGILWRYFKLFIPVDLRFVKYEVRDLCMLRLLHAFCEGAPMLLIQLYLLWHETATKEFTDLNLVSMTLSLFSVCWALASFSKNVRMQNVHRLVLTWLGVIFQFMWRLGTVSARVLTLTAYATLYGRWVFLVLGLHWVSMFLWLISPNNVFHGERISRRRKAAFASLIAFVYIFAYINLQEVNHRHKMVIFYVVMGLENALLVFVCQLGISANSNSPDSLPLLVFTLFFCGLIFQTLYYRCFHVRRLNYEAGGRLSDNGSTIRLTSASKELVRRHSFSGAYSSNGSAAHSNEARILHTASQQPIKYRYHCAGTESHHHSGIPGVFNCRFTNPYTAAMTKRKKKKPTSFVPPPSVEEGQVVHPVPFWCRPLHNHQGGSSENEGSSIGSRVNIQQKLQEKKQKQLAELRVIEEEIKQGKLHPPSAAPEPPPPPPPRGKQTPRPGTKEILLAPHYLDSDPIYRLCEDGSAETSDQMMLLMCKWYRVGSDIDSQVSLPRSYTLPREFKYYRRARSRRPLSSHHFTQSNNSSDGDVDSADDNDSESSQAASQQRPIRIAKPLYRFKHETKL